MKNVLWLLLFPLITNGQMIYTVSGTGLAGDSGDNGPATIAKIYYPSVISFDNYGNYYFVEAMHNVVRKVSVCGVITTVAGNGTAGFGGDGLSATLAVLDYPISITFDAYNNMYIDDFNNNRIRKVDAISGTISTYAGNGVGGFSGDGVSATATALNAPSGIACDLFGNLFISDHLNNRIRKVDISGIMSTYVGTGIAGFSGDGGLSDTAKINSPGPLACALDGSLYFSDNNNVRIRKVERTTGIITTIAGNGTIGFSGDGHPATLCQLWCGACEIAIDSTNNVFVSDENNQRVRKIDNLGIINTIAGNGTTGYGGDGFPATSAIFNDPEGVGCSSFGNIYVADFSNHRIRKIRYTTADTVSIYLHGLPSVPIGSTVTVNAVVSNAGSSYIIHWLNHGIEFTTTTVPVVTYTKGPGTDTITARVVPASYGCWDSTTSGGHIVYESAEAVPTINAAEQGIVLYPNPVHDELTIATTEQAETFGVLNALGQQLITGALISRRQTVSTEQLPPGLYFVKVTGVGGAAIGRFIKR